MDPFQTDKAEADFIEILKSHNVKSGYKKALTRKQNHLRLIYLKHSLYRQN